MYAAQLLTSAATFWLKHSRAIDKIFAARYHFNDLPDVLKADVLVGSS